MASAIEYDSHTLRVLKKLGPAIRKEIVDYMDHRVAAAEDPRDFGKPIGGDKAGLIGCAITESSCRIEDDNLVALVIEVGHRSASYE